MIEILITALVAILIGLVVKFLLSFFNLTKPYADPIGVICAILYFLNRIGAI